MVIRGVDVLQLLATCLVSRLALGLFVGAEPKHSLLIELSGESMDCGLGLGEMLGDTIDLHPELVLNEADSLVVPLKRSSLDRVYPLVETFVALVLQSPLCSKLRLFGCDFRFARGVRLLLQHLAMSAVLGELLLGVVLALAQSRFGVL